MCEAIRGMIEDGRIEGRLEGKIEGKYEGALEKTRTVARNMYLRGMSAEDAVARSAGVGHRCIQSSQIGWTRDTGVCWLMISKTRVPQSDTSSCRIGRSRLLDANQRGRS